MFLCIITPQYGSGVVGDDLSITHQELLQAIALDKPRWILAHDHVVFARSLLRKLGATDETTRRDLLAKLGFADRDSLKRLHERESAVLDDFRVIDTYDAAIRHDLRVYRERTGNWVQKFSATQEANLFVTAQFSRYMEVEQFLHDNFRSPPALPIRNAGLKENP